MHLKRLRKRVGNIENKATKKILRGDVVLAKLRWPRGSEQGGVRPAIIVQNNTGNKVAPTVIVVPITTQVKPDLPTHVNLCNIPFLDVRSVATCEQITTIDKNYVIRKMGTLNDPAMRQVEQAVSVSLGKGGVFERI